MNLDPEALTRCVDKLQGQLPELQAVYLFGSQAGGQADAGSDVDLAVLLPVPLAATRRWMLVEPLAELLGREVDLVDLRAAMPDSILRIELLDTDPLVWRRVSHGKCHRRWPG